MTVTSAHVAADTTAGDIDTVAMRLANGATILEALGGLATRERRLTARWAIELELGPPHAYDVTVWSAKCPDPMTAADTLCRIAKQIRTGRT